MGQAEAETMKESRKKTLEKAEHRIFVAAYEDARGNEEYKNYADKIIELGRKISEHLGANNYLFAEYENLVGLSEAIYAENVYLVGHEDGRKTSRKACIKSGCQMGCQSSF
ncbi:MAG: hypothetical protein ACYC3E_00145 [Carboxydocellales bacterium]